MLTSNQQLTTNNQQLTTNNYNIPMRILLVEDEPDAARMLAKGLREHAYAVDLVDDGDAAIYQT